MIRHIVMWKFKDFAEGLSREENILKVKAMQTCDIRCLRIEEGEGKYQGKLGKIICNYKGENKVYISQISPATLYGRYFRDK